MDMNERANRLGFARQIGQVSRPVVQRYPSWMDAQYQLAACSGQWSDIITIDSTGEFLVEGNSRRWALGFSLPNTVGTDVDVSPIQGPGLFMFGRCQTARPLLFTLSDIGPFVTYPWRAFGSAGQTFRYWWVEVR